MTRPYLNPLGFIDKLTGTGATIILTNPKDSKNLEPATPVTIWKYSRAHLAPHRIQGEITRVGYTTAVLETTDPRNRPPGGHRARRPSRRRRRCTSA